MRAPTQQQPHSSTSAVCMELSHPKHLPHQLVLLGALLRAAGTGRSPVTLTSNLPTFCSSLTLLPERYCHARPRSEGGIPFWHRSRICAGNKAVRGAAEQQGAPRVPAQDVGWASTATPIPGDVSSYRWGQGAQPRAVLTHLGIPGSPQPLLPTPALSMPVRAAGRRLELAEVMQPANSSQQA